MENGVPVRNIVAALRKLGEFAPRGGEGPSGGLANLAGSRAKRFPRPAGRRRFGRRPGPRRHPLPTEFL